MPSPSQNHLTPGRGAMVWFFPFQSYEVLKDKPKDWGITTNYGRDDGQGPDQKKNKDEREKRKRKRKERESD